MQTLIELLNPKGAFIPALKYGVFSANRPKSLFYKAWLLIIHIDELYDGAEINDLVGDLYGWKALHVQVMTTQTRHNRPGYTVMVEVDADDEWRLAKGRAQHYGIARYHRLETVLQYQPMARIKRLEKVLMREDGFVVELAEG